MTKTRRFLNLKVMVIVATLLCAVVGYFAARKVMAWEIEVVMDRVALIKLLGEPTEFGLSFDSQNKAPDVWERTVFNESIYQRYIVVNYDAEGKATLIFIYDKVFGYQFQRCIH